MYPWKYNVKGDSYLNFFGHWLQQTSDYACSEDTKQDFICRLQHCLNLNSLKHTPQTIDSLPCSENIQIQRSRDTAESNTLEYNTEQPLPCVWNNTNLIFHLIIHLHSFQKILHIGRILLVDRNVSQWTCFLFDIQMPQVSAHVNRRVVWRTENRYVQDINHEISNVSPQNHNVNHSNKKGLQKLSDANDYHLPIVFQVTAWNPELTMHWI